jgi:MYXO-CTERM domain-containing protein
MKIRFLSSLASGLAIALMASNAFADVTIDRTKKYQTIEGFGFFGGADVWWGGPSAVLDDAWSAMVIDDLGMTMWRNEYYPTATSAAPQDAQWTDQKPVVQSLYSHAHASKVPLKAILTIWSPPANDKCIVVKGGVPDYGTCATPLQRPTDTKGGNILDPSQATAFANWLVAGLQMYKDAGVDVYGLSMQNEPMFWQGYNSCFYEQSFYAKHLSEVGAIVKASFPHVKLFGSENMLGIECGAGANGTNFDPYFYTQAIMNNAGALSAIDRFAVHGYTDGVSATATSKLATLWTSLRTGTASANKPLWMTETSGYNHSWTSGQPCMSDNKKTCPGAIDLGQAIYAALYYGHASAWTYWQGSGKSGLSEYSLMAGTSPGKNYYVSKQFYRYIRPGAQMVDVRSTDAEVMVAAFDNPAMNAVTVVAINTGTATKTLTLSGANLPSTFHAFRTSANEDAKDLGSVNAGGLTLPASSITTFVSGNYLESAVTGTDAGVDSGAPIDSGAGHDTGASSDTRSATDASATTTTTTTSTTTKADAATDSAGDGGTPGTKSTGGCGCRVGQGDSRSSGAMLAMWAAATAWMFRRRKSSVATRR